MTFTTTPPTEPGAYWWKPLEAFEEAELKEVWAFTTGALMTTDLNKNGVPVSYVSGLWSSKLVPLDEYVEKAEKSYLEALRDIKAIHTRWYRGDMTADEAVREMEAIAVGVWMKEEKC